MFRPYCFADLAGTSILFEFRTIDFQLFSVVRSRRVLHRHLAVVDLRINARSFAHRFETAMPVALVAICLLSLWLCIIIELEPSTNRLYSYMCALHIAIFVSHCYETRIVVIILSMSFLSFLYFSQTLQGTSVNLSTE